MKNLSTLLVLITCMISFASQASDTTHKHSHKLRIDSLSCLEIEGRVRHTIIDDHSDCKIELICNGVIEDSEVLRHGKTKFRMILKRDSYYTLRISKKGFASRLVCINTAYAGEPDGLYRFLFETDLITEMEAKQLDSDAMDFPIAVIYFDDRAHHFNYSKEYTTSIKKNLFASIGMR